MLFDFLFPSKLPKRRLYLLSRLVTSYHPLTVQHTTTSAPRHEPATWTTLKMPTPVGLAPTHLQIRNLTNYPLLYEAVTRSCTQQHHLTFSLHPNNHHKWYPHEHTSTTTSCSVLLLTSNIL